MTRLRVTIEIDAARAGQISQAAVERGVRAATIEAKNLTIGILSQPGKGRAYKRGAKFHIASRPGDPPAPDTGRLRNSVQTEVFRLPDGAVGRVSVNTEYARALELGTERIAARPFLGRALTEHGQRLSAVFAQFARSAD